MKLVLITGTGTEIGKTWVTARAATALFERGGIAVAARKPAQSFAADSQQPTDADVLGAATGEDPFTVCPEHRWLPVAMAPPMAAASLGLPPFTIDDLAREIAAPTPDVAIVLVESAGGVRSPLADDGDTATLARALQPALIVVVADAGLGTINAVRLSADALASHAVVVFLNRFDPHDELHCRNRDWLATNDRLDVVADVAALADRIAR